MEDAVIRAREIEAIVSVVGGLKAAMPSAPLRVLDLGCGNGYALEVLASAYPQHRYTGLDFSADMLALARRRALRGCQWRQGDARALPFPPASFDLVYTERCLINILDRRGQERALGDIHRVLAPGGHYLMIECFTDGMAALNRARTECGLEAISEAHHNRYFDKPAFRRAVAPLFDVVEPAAFAALPPANFLSSHYFAARVLHPLVTKGTQVRNTEFVKFFSHLPPYGEYAPLQIFMLRALGRRGHRTGRRAR
jgi:SAM-dependent methyltransferase